MKKAEITLIPGGLAPENRKKEFKSAYVTNTRLMGVLAIRATWQLMPANEGDKSSKFYQFFYIDCEETGLETYTSFIDPKKKDLDMTEQALIGGLGASKIRITEDELSALISYYADFNERHNIPLAQRRYEYDFLIRDIPSGPVYSSKLMKKICTKVASDYEAVNYFLMRCFGHDENGANFLTAPSALGVLPIDAYYKYPAATFYRNRIELSNLLEDSTRVFLCDSLIESEAQYYIVTSRIGVKNCQIVSLENLSEFKISTIEAANLLHKDEYVIVCDLLMSMEEIENNLGEFTVGLNAIMSEHENGRMFMVFNKDNSHVDKPLFQLSNDSFGVYYITDSGQLLIVANSGYNATALHHNLQVRPIGPYIKVGEKYLFDTPIFYEFITSDFDDFSDYLDFLNSIQ